MPRGFQILMRRCPSVPKVVLGLVAAAAAVAQTPAEPFTTSVRWSNYLQRTYSPERLAFLAVDSAIDNALRQPHCWDNSASSFGRRFGMSFERRIVKNTFELGAGIVTGQDLRYHPAHSRSFQSRVWNAVRASAMARTPSGAEQPAYTRFLAVAVMDISTANWTDRAIKGRWLARSVGWSVIDQAQTNLLDEFTPDLRRFGERVWRRVRPNTK
jgi:hypothetical protein